MAQFFDPPSQGAIDNYHRAVSDWITNAHRDANLGLVPRPFPNPPNSRSYTEGDKLETIDTGQLGIPQEGVPIKFAWAEVAGFKRLVIVVPDPL